MKIKDSTVESVERKSKLKGIEMLAKEIFDDCTISTDGHFYVHISHSPSGSEIAYISLIPDSGLMTLKESSYEKKAVEFGKEYEKRGLHKPMRREGSFLNCLLYSISREKSFVLDKDYSEKNSLINTLGKLEEG